MKWIFFDINKDVTDAFTKYLSDYGEVINGSFENLKCDAIVSPANSFGFMDGGIDLAYSNFFGWGVQERLQKIIKTKWQGEIPVGCADVVGTLKENGIQHLISAPTMRVPLDIQNTINVYLAMKAIVRISKEWSFNTIAVPGLGTGCGGVVPERMAWLMLNALEDKCFPSSLTLASLQHKELL